MSSCSYSPNISSSSNEAHSNMPFDSARDNDNDAHFLKMKMTEKDLTCDI